MENPVRNIPTEDPFRRRLFGPTTIISDEKFKSSDCTDGVVYVAENENNKCIEIVKRTQSHMPDIRILSDENSSNKDQVCRRSQIDPRSNQCSQNPETFRTPQKKCLEPSQYKCDTPKMNLNATLCENSKLIHESSNTWSSKPPRSPILTPRSSLGHRVPHSANTYNSCDIFNFSPESTEHYLIETETQSALVKKTLFDEITGGTTCDQHTHRELKSPVYCAALNSPSHCQRDMLTSHRQLISRNSRDMASSREQQQDTDIQHYRTSTSGRCELVSCCIDTEPYLAAKRILDVDEDCISTSKRLKIDLERQMGQRYLKQLATDISEIKQFSNCTCAIMERQFLEMAESAYRSVRRLDDSPQGFEQFRRELVQTNEVMKDSMNVLKGIKSFCEHRCNLR